MARATTAVPSSARVGQARGKHQRLCDPHEQNGRPRKRAATTAAAPRIATGAALGRPSSGGPSAVALDLQLGEQGGVMTKIGQGLTMVWVHALIARRLPFLVS